MTTANLKRFAEAIYEHSTSKYPQSKRRAKLFGFICFCFLIGTVAGGISTSYWHNKALRIPIVIFGIASALSWERYTGGEVYKISLKKL